LKEMGEVCQPSVAANLEKADARADTPVGIA
jgi:hypothetical protein